MDDAKIKDCYKVKFKCDSCSYEFYFIHFIEVLEKFQKEGCMKCGGNLEKVSPILECD